MSAVSDAVQRVLLQRHVKEVIGDLHDEQTAEAGALLDVGDKKVASLGAVPLGKVELRPAVPSAKVVDRAALMAWIKETHPDWIKAGPDVEPLKQAIANAHKWPAAGHDEVRLILSAASAQLEALQRIPAVSLREGVEPGLIENVKSNGMWVEPKTGEACEVPGVEYSAGEPKAVVTIDRKNGAPAAVRELLTSGGLPALTMGETS